MDKILIMFGDQTKDVRRNLEKNYLESITVIDALPTPTDFHAEYAESPLRVQRILINESAILREPFTQIAKLKETLDSFHVQFEKCYILATKGGELERLYSYLATDDTFVSRNKLVLYTHETYTAGLVTEYCLDNIPKRHFIKDEVEYDEIIRVKRSDQKTFKMIEEDAEEFKPETKMVLMDSDTVTPVEIQEKLKNLISSANSVKGEKWENNKIIKDILSLEQLADISSQVAKYEIDYSRFYTDQDLSTRQKNLYVVTGDKRSGTSTFAYGLAKSAINAKKKVLLLDFATEDFGLSFLVENQKDQSAVMRLQDFRKSFDSALQTLVKGDLLLNIVALNSLTEKELGDIPPLPLLSLIATASQKYFDLVIIDVGIDKLDSIVNIVSNSSKLIITTPSTLTCLYSVFKQIKEKSIIQLFPSTRKILVPTSIFNAISKNNYTTSEITRRLTKEVYGDNIGVLSRIHFNSFELTDSLLSAVESI